MPRTSVTVILIHWNQSRPCLETIEKFRGQPEVTRFLVVDNGSRPAELEHLRANLPADVELIEVGRNSGFGPGANRGWERWLETDDGSDWSVIAPHDAHPGDGTIAAMLDAVADRHVGLMSADVGDGYTPEVQPYLGTIDAPATVDEGFEPADYPHGTLLMAHRQCLTDIGLFDERYFAYCEEADLGLRAKAAGWEVGLIRGARVYNQHVNTPAPIVDYLKERNTLLLLADHFGRRQVAFRALVALWQLGAGVVRPSTRAEYWSGRARVYALRDAALRRWGPPPDAVFALKN